MENCQPRVGSKLRLQSRGLASLTIRHRVDNLSSFCKWAVQRGYMLELPLRGMAPFAKKARSVRRALTPEEIQKLLMVAPPHRQLVYEVALCSGLRAGELSALRVSDLDVARNGLLLREECTKNRKAGFQPLPSFVVERLKTDSKGKQSSDALLRIDARSGHAARDLDIDLQAAGIPKSTPAGKIHSLRVVYTTFVIESGANIKEAQALARPATPELTLRLCARTNRQAGRAR